MLYPANFSERFGADCPAIELREYTYAAAAAAAAWPTCVSPIDDVSSIIAAISPGSTQRLQAAHLAKGGYPPCRRRSITTLSRAREIISDEKNWTQFDYAQLDSSDEADPADPLAVRFCGVGALRRAAYELSSDSDSFATLTDRVQDGIESFARTRRHLKSNFSLEDLNDDQNGHANVLKLFDDYLANS